MSRPGEGMRVRFKPSGATVLVPRGAFLTLAGSFGLFFTLFLFFLRYLPMVAMAEVKAILPRAHGERHP